jgi:tRNA A-37 threonylcarbamoyl transferase component Bud32
VALAIGTRLGPYEVLAFIGAGGMGEVYRARDTTLNRDVALKILPDGVFRDPDRLGRFKREAQVLASLNHPNVGAIYGFEAAGQVHALVLELVDGVTLADRIAAGAVPLDEALSIARQIADGLEAAHERGIVHRDLKPANIKLRSDGTVKVLDFGLAKAIETAPVVASNVTVSPTMTSPMTRMDVILGTAAYMSPEQARGKPIDKRSDIWSFGCVLFEMLTGRTAFAGETASDSIARVLEREPAIDALPANTPVQIRRVIGRALQKDLRHRLHDIGDARIEIDDAMAGRPESASPMTSIGVARHRGVIALIAAAALVIGAIAGTMVGNRTVRGSGPVMRLPLLAPSGETPVDVAVSPDGRHVAMATIGPRAGIWFRPLDSAETRLLPGSEDQSTVFWSPDSRSIGSIGQDGKVRRIDIAGGAATVLADGANVAGGGAWSANGVILFGAGKTIRGVNAVSGASISVEVADDGDERSLPYFLPDGNHFVYLAGSAGKGVIRAGSLRSRETQSIVQADSGAVYSSAGYLLFLRGAVLMAQPFDAQALTLSGDARPLAADAAAGNLSSYAVFSTAGRDVLAYIRTRSGNDGQLKWFDRSGRELSAIGSPPGVDYQNPSLSPDQTRVAVSSMDPHSGNWDIWVIDLDSMIPTRITSDPAQDADAVWSPDSKEIGFISNRGGSFGLYRKRLGGNGAEELLLKTATEPRMTDWTSDGRFLIYELNWDVFALPLTGTNRSPIPIATTAFKEYGASTSADGRWIAYASNESGEYQVYIQSFPKPGERKRVSTVFGIHPRWRRDGRELVYWQPPGGLMSVDLRYERGSIYASAPKPTLPSTVGVLDVLDSRHHHAMSADGQRFLVRQPRGPAGPPINVVLNWASALQK